MIQVRITCKKILLYKSIEFAENLIFFLVSMKGKTLDKSEFVTKLVGIIVSIFFHTEISLKIACQIFATQCFFTDHFKHKTVKKTICRMPSANPYAY